MYQLVIDEEHGETTAKCTSEKCKEAGTVPHVWQKIMPFSPNDGPMDTLMLLKRLIMCTNCGKLSLKD